ncbi:TetR/AcrR family transcriptional regulator [Variovorax sp. dw_954]|uniref:TetR/AcrR family transcriptional regulator n=1 Tax=Variovorax sp. dw_954 TaxID=2720078 RepID=UPI001BD1D9DC|nr:TetR/AcrR family transcriptional regulator [Variovorax sp. dw_954]
MKPEAKPSTSTAKVTPIAAGKQTPRRLRRAAEILAAARAVFLEKGFERASVGEIAARVGVVEGLVYTYFPTKRDLLNEVLRGMYEPLIEDIATSFARIHGLRSRLRFLVWRHLRVYVEEPSLSRIVLHEVRTSPEYFKSVLHDLHVRYTAFLLHTVHEAVDSGELPAGTDAELVRSMVYGGIEHRMWAQLFGRGGAVDVEAMADQFTALLLNGLLMEDAVAAQPAAGSPADIERRLARLERIVAGAAAEDVRSMPTVAAPPATVAAKQPVAAKRRKARS